MHFPFEKCSAELQVRKNMEATRTQRRKGQTSVEYILLLAMIVGVFAVVRVVFEPQVVTGVASLIQSAQVEAWVGGSPSGFDNPHYYYYKSPTGDGMMEVK
jgi:hypothetical protein